jgi:hypothetical protein
MGWNLFALREAFQDQSPLLDRRQFASDLSSNGDRLGFLKGDFFSRPAASGTTFPIHQRPTSSHFRARPDSPQKTSFPSIGGSNPDTFDSLASKDGLDRKWSASIQKKLIRFHSRYSRR